LSQLDTLNQVVRAIRQSGMPVMYTEGHVPRPRVGFSPACPTGIESAAEYFEADCAGFPDPDVYAGKLEKLLPDGLEILEGKEIPFDTPSFNELIRSTTYAVTTATEIDLATALAAFTAVEMRCVRVTRKGKPRLIDAKTGITRAEVRGRELVLTLGFSRFGTIKIGEAVAAVLGREAAHGARIRKEAAEIGSEPLTREAPEKLIARGDVLDLTDLNERRTPETEGERGEAHVPYTEP
jgi:radical SAM-linked protein